MKHRGAWPGNDTIWRMVADLWQGMMKRERKYFSVIDGIISGEGQGPFCPTSKNANTIIAGENLPACDFVGTRYMGFDPLRLNYLKYFADKGEISPEDISVTVHGSNVRDFFSSLSRYLDFQTVSQWECIKIPRP